MHKVFFINRLNLVMARRGNKRGLHEARILAHQLKRIFSFGQANRPELAGVIGIDHV